MTASNATGSHCANSAARQDQTETDATIIGDGHSADKTLANLTALAALAGYEVHPLSDGSFLVCRWNLSRPCSDLQALSTFLRMLGVLH